MRRLAVRPKLQMQWTRTTSPSKICSPLSPRPRRLRLRFPTSAPRVSPTRAALPNSRPLPGCAIRVRSLPQCSTPIGTSSSSRSRVFRRVPRRGFPSDRPRARWRARPGPRAAAAFDLPDQQSAFAPRARAKPKRLAQGSQRARVPTLPAHLFATYCCSVGRRKTACAVAAVPLLGWRGSANRRASESFPANSCPCASARCADEERWTERRPQRYAEFFVPLPKGAHR